MGLRTFLDNVLKSPNPVFDHRVDASPMLFRGQFDPLRAPEWQVRPANWSYWDADTSRSDAVRKSVIVFACLSYLADAVAEATPTVEVLTEADGWQPGEDRPSALLQSVLSRPNPFMEDAEFVSLLVYQMGVQGYAVVEKVRNGGGLPVELWPLRPDWLTAIPQTAAYRYAVPAQEPRRIPAEDLIFIPWRHDDRMERIGVGPVQIAAREIGIDAALTDFLKTFLDAGGIPPYVIMYDEAITDEAQIELIQEKWRQKYGGSKAWGALPVFHGGYRLEQIGQSINEMAWPDLRGLTELKICQAFRVPADLVQARETLVSGSLTTTEADGAMTQLQQYGAEPLRSRLAAALGRGLLPDFGLDHTRYRVAFDISHILALQEDEDKKHARWRENWDAGIVMLDEIRMALDLPELPSQQGQVFKVPFNVVMTQPAELSLTVPPLTGGNPQSVTAVQQEPLALTPGKGQRRYMDTRALSDQQFEFRSRSMQRIRRDRARLVEQGARHIGRMLKAQGDRLSASLAKSERLIETKDLLDIDWQQEEDELARVLNEFYMRNGAAAYEATAGLLGTEHVWEISNPNIARLMDLLAQRVVGINATTRGIVQQIVSDGLTAGRSVVQIADDLSSHIEATYKDRALTIARTESMYSYGQASALSYQESRVVNEVELMDNPEHDTEPSKIDGLTCAERDGLVVALANVGLHLDSEHPNGSLTVLPVLASPLGED